MYFVNVLCSSIMRCSLYCDVELFDFPSLNGLVVVSPFVADFGQVGVH